jgi:hypothetical protein
MDYRLLQNNKNLMTSINSITIQSLSIQFLETLFILENSKNVETIQNRIEFLEMLTDKLKALSNNPDYQYYIQLGVDDYYVRYFNRNTSDIDLSCLARPGSFELDTYCINTLINGLKRFVDEQLDEIHFLKGNSAKEKRISKVSHNILLAKNYLQMKYCESKSYALGIDEIEKIIKKIKEIHSL